MTAAVVTDVVSAAAISATIVTMSVLRNPARKAFVYSLPLPVTIALVATGGHVGGSSVVGLGLLVGFLWLTRLLYAVTGSIGVADVASALSYVILAWLVTTLVDVDFASAATVFVLLWAAFVATYRPGPPAVGRADGVDVRVKGVVVFALSLVLLSLRSLLAGAVVTFPYTGVFAVVEARESLAQLAAVFTRNSIGILALLAVVRELEPATGLWRALLLGWLAYGLVIVLVRRPGLRGTPPSPAASRH